MAKKENTFAPTHIIVVEAGWVLAVETPDYKLESNVVSKNARVIRRWGTTDGLAQLALRGPTNDTQLEPCSVVCIPASKILMAFVVESEGWD